MRYAGKLGKECENADFHCVIILLRYTYIDLIGRVKMQMESKIYVN